MRLVQKYGGTSVANTDLILKIAQEAAEIAKSGVELVIVVSAMNKTTDGLIALSKKVSNGNNKRELDALLSTGEMQTCSLMAMAIESIGVPAISMSGFQAGIITNSSHSKALINKMNTELIEKELSQGKVVVVAGFQGIDELGNITTLGRGGSDTTAVSIAAALNCPCEIYTDVESVYSIDPRLYPKAKKIHKVLYEEMSEMAISGAKVLETRCIEIAAKYGVDLYLGKALEKDKTRGTYIVGKLESFEQMAVTGLTVKNDYSVLMFKELTDEKMRSIFERVTDVNIDMITQAYVDGKMVFGFTCSDEQAQEFLVKIDEDIVSQNISVEVKSNLSKITLVGLGMATRSGVAISIFSTLMNEGIKYYETSTSEISISLIIKKQDVDRAVTVLAELFEL